MLGAAEFNHQTQPQPLYREAVILRRQPLLTGQDFDPAGAMPQPHRRLDLVASRAAGAAPLLLRHAAIFEQAVGGQLGRMDTHGNRSTPRSRVRFRVNSSAPPVYPVAGTCVGVAFNPEAQNLETVS